MQYNDRSDAALPVGQMVYLKRKKSRAARGYEFHRVKPVTTCTAFPSNTVFA